MIMSENNICSTLRDRIRTSLIPLIPDDYILLDLPYYSNIGDILIWQGTEDFLKELPGQCLGRHSKETFDFRPLPKDCIILLLGGGNFGDIWREHQEFRLEVMRIYPENPIIVLPQTIYYESDNVLVEDIKKMNMHRHLTICTRDRHSIELLKERGFYGNLLMLPDMAFCIKQEKLQENMADASRKSLIIFREDKELKEPKLSNKYVSSFFSDWPQMQESGALAWQFLMTHKDDDSDSFFINEFFPRQVKTGVKFVSSYKYVCSTRLHAAILRLLLGLPVKIVDNSYGKNLNFYNTWLKDSPLVSTPNEEEQEAIDVAILVHKREQEYEKRIAEIIQKQQEQELLFAEKLKQKEESLGQQAEKINLQGERIWQLQQKVEWELKRHRKYKRLFNAAMIILALLCATLTTGLILFK